MQNIRLELRAVGYKEGQRWIAHCLELDVVGQGDTADASIRQMIELASLQIVDALENGALRSIFFPAPPEIWELFSRAVSRPKPRSLNMPDQVERFDYRALAYA